MGNKRLSLPEDEGDAEDGADSVPLPAAVEFAEITVDTPAEGEAVEPLPVADNGPLAVPPPVAVDSEVAEMDVDSLGTMVTVPLTTVEPETVGTNCVAPVGTNTVSPPVAVELDRPT